MDWVIPVKPALRNEELRYTLRGLAAFADPGRVVLVGGPVPRWVNPGTVEVVSRRPIGNKHHTTSSHLAFAAEHLDLSDPWVYANDDMFALRPVAEIRTYHSGPIRQVVERWRGKRSPYFLAMEQTASALRKDGYDDPLCYELHLPLPVRSEPLLEALALARRYGLAMPHKRSIYGAVAGAGGEYASDVKRHPRVGDAWCSSSDATFRQIEPVLRYLLPNPCEFERWSLLP